MAKREPALEALFYLYPCLLFVSLLGVQTFQFYLERKREARRSASPVVAETKQSDERTKRIAAWLIWMLQLVLCFLLLASIVLAVREALREPHHSLKGKIVFSSSAYLVCLSIVLLVRPCPC
jgi:ABC-type Fe3+ transport system permease subunit